MASDGIRRVTINGVPFVPAAEVERRRYSLDVQLNEENDELAGELEAAHDELNRLLGQLQHAAALALELHAAGACPTCDAIAARGFGVQPARRA